MTKLETKLAELKAGFKIKCRFCKADHGFDIKHKDFDTPESFWICKGCGEGFRYETSERFWTRRQIPKLIKVIEKLIEQRDCFVGLRQRDPELTRIGLNEEIESILEGE
jgi:transposase-like protein